jgi:hypothetical protein
MFDEMMAIPPDLRRPAVFVRFALVISAIVAGDFRVRRRRRGDWQDRSAQTTGSD